MWTETEMENDTLDGRIIIRYEEHSTRPSERNPMGSVWL